MTYFSIRVLFHLHKLYFISEDFDKDFKAFSLSLSNKDDRRSSFRCSVFGHLFRDTLYFIFEIRNDTRCTTIYKIEGNVLRNKGCDIFN